MIQRRQAMSVGFIGVTMRAPFAIFSRVAMRISDTAFICGHSIGDMYMPRRRMQ
jgi:hypothetical protein